MEKKFPNGMWPVMLTPLQQNGDEAHRMFPASSTPWQVAWAPTGILV